MIYKLPHFHLEPDIQFDGVAVHMTYREPHVLCCQTFVDSPDHDTVNANLDHIKNAKSVQVDYRNGESAVYKISSLRSIFAVNAYGEHRHYHSVGDPESIMIIWNVEEKEES